MHEKNGSWIYSITVKGRRKTGIPSRINGRKNTRLLTLEGFTHYFNNVNRVPGKKYYTQTLALFHALATLHGSEHAMPKVGRYFTALLRNTRMSPLLFAKFMRLHAPR